jgi:hypothetical protein
MASRLTIAAVLVTIGGRVASAQDLSAFADDPPVTEADIEVALSPDGEWVDVAPWGRVWQPDDELATDSFVPYTSNGQWLYGAYGWTFDSNYSWGWAAFHFGHWVFVAELGWVWTPGAGADAVIPVWGPAWVTWRTDGDVVEWVPTPPADARPDPQYASLWSVVPLQQLQRSDLSRHLLSPDRVLSRTGKAAPPRGMGVAVAPRARWRGYPHLRATLAASTGEPLILAPILAPVLAPSAWGPSAILWTGLGASVHAPIGMGNAAGASPLWTGPGSSVFASPAYGDAGGRRAPHGPP